MQVCKRCHTVAEPRKETPGSLAIEVVLWLCFLVPGLVYSLWRLSRRHDVCRACGSRDLVPLDSPVGRSLAGDAVTGTYRGSPRAEEFGRRIGRLFAKK